MANKKISELTELTTPVDADVAPIVDTSATETKKVTWANIKATLKTYFDTLYGASADVTLNTTHRSSNGTDHSYIDQDVTSGSTPTFTNTNFTEATDKNYVTDAEKVVIGNTSNTNTGDQTSIVGITGTKAQFDTAVTDGNITYDGDAPTAHNTSHQSGGGDAIKLDDLASPDDNTDLNVSITAHGLTPKLSNNSGQFLDGTGNWSAPSGSGDVLGPATNTDSYIPQWDGANSKTLKNGLAAPTGALVGISDNQTLTTKSIDADNNTITNIGNSELNAVAGDIGGAWDSFTPAWTNLTVGNGTNEGFYTQIGKTIHFRLYFLFGSTSSIGSNVKIDLPVTGASYGGVTPIGLCRFFLGATAYSGVVQQNGYIRVFGASSTYTTLLLTTATIPATWAEGDEIEISGTYQAA